MLLKKEVVRRWYIFRGTSLSVQDSFGTYTFGACFFGTASFDTWNVNIGTVTFGTYKISVGYSQLRYIN